MKNGEVYSVAELIEELKKFPQDAVVTIGICQPKGHRVRRAHCARDLVHEVDYVRNGNGEPIMDAILLHGAP